ncbi:MAG: sodium:solute symporter, partial [Gemmatimonadales bacterium]
MSRLADNWLILLLLAGYVALMAWHAVVGKRRTRGLTDYYVGGRAMGGIALGLSFFATYSSTNSFVGFAGQAYSYGIAWLLLIPAIVSFCVLAWVWIAPRLRAVTESLDSVTIPDFMGFRFGSDVARFTAALIVVFASLLYMTAVFKGAGTLLQAVLGISYVWAIVLVLVIVMAYTAAGGFISVVKTDVVQGVIMILAALFLFTGTVSASGGLGSFLTVRKSLEGARLFEWDAAMPLPVLLGIVVAGTFKLVVEPRQLSRFYALKDKRAVRAGMWTSTAAFLVVYLMLVPIGIYARNLYPSGITDTDRVIPEMLSGGAVFHPAVASFLVLAMIAAAMSSLDSVLLVLASTCERDIVSLIRPPQSEARALLATRVYVALFAVATAVIALEP